MNSEKPILDIKDRQKTFDIIQDKFETISEGLRAVYADYNYHIEITHGDDSEILRLKENIDYRFFAARFHLELILKQHYHIERRIEKLYKENPKKVINKVYPSHPLYNYCENEITAMLDSLIFHLASIFDYFSAIVNYVVNKKNQSIKKWSQLARASRDKRNDYSKKKISEIINREHNSFVNKLYEYRSRVIHEKSERNSCQISIQMKSGKTTANFVAVNSLTKLFSELKEKSKTHKLTVNYVSQWLIESTVNSVSNIMLGLKEEMEKKSTFPDHIKDEDLIVLYRDPITQIAYSASRPIWEKFVKNIKTYNAYNKS